MSSKINKLEKETATWKQRWEKSHEAYLEMSNEKTKAESELITTCRQLAALLKLCRTLQTERAEMLAKLNGAGGYSYLILSYMKKFDRRNCNNGGLMEPKSKREG
jgi:Myosin-like coiled-coil protein.